MTPDGRLTVSASHDQTLEVWKFASGSELRALAGYTSRVHGVALIGDGRLAASASWDQTLKVWGVASGQQLCTFTADARLLCCDISPDGKLVVGGDQSGVVHLLGLFLSPDILAPRNRS